MTREEFDAYNAQIDNVLFGPENEDVRDYEAGEFFKVWKYRGLLDVKDNCPDRAARNFMRKWVKQRTVQLWEELGFPSVSEDWNYWKAHE